MYLEGSGGLSKYIMGIIRVTIWFIVVINLLTKSPDPPSSETRQTGCRECCWLIDALQQRHLKDMAHAPNEYLLPAAHEQTINCGKGHVTLVKTASVRNRMQ